MVLTQVLDRDDPILGFAHGWMEALAAHLDYLIVVPLKGGRHELPSNVEVRSLGKEAGGGAIDRVKALRRVVGGACRRGEVDAILAHMVPRYAVYSAPFAMPRRIPLFLWYTHKGVDWSLRMAEPLIRRAYTASEQSFRLPSKKKVVTGHGIDTEWFSPPPADALATDADIAVVGRIAPAKDPLTLIEALGILSAEGTRLKTLLVGDTLLDDHDAYKEQVRSRIGQLDLVDQVEFLGAVPHPEVRRAFWRAPLFCSPSLTGSVDKTVLEAMSCGGIPVTCNESFHDVFTPELADQLMFEKGDAEGLAARFRALLSLSTEDRRELARRLRNIVVEHHNLGHLAARLVTDMKAHLGPSVTRS